MPIAKASIKADVWDVLNKSGTYPGFYEDLKVENAIGDVLDFLAAKMMIANEGWTTQVTLINTTAGQKEFPLPDNVSIIYGVRYKSGDSYSQVPFDMGAFSANDAGTGTTAFPASYKLRGSSIVFDVAPSEYGTGYLQVESSFYPSHFDVSNNLASQFDVGMVQFIKWAAASQLANQIGRENPTWKQYELKWEGVIDQIIGRRNVSPTHVREWNG